MFRASRGGGRAVTYLMGAPVGVDVEIHLTWDLRHPVWESRIFDIHGLARPPAEFHLWRSDFLCQVASDALLSPEWIRCLLLATRGA